VSQSQVKKNWEPVKRISIDEIAMRKGHKSFKTVVSDLERGKLIEVINGHNQESIVEKLMEREARRVEYSIRQTSQPLELREMVKEVSIDMWGGFAKIIPQIFPLFSDSY